MLIYCLQLFTIVNCDIQICLAAVWDSLYTRLTVTCDSFTSESCSLWKCSIKSCIRTTSSTIVHNIILFRFVHSIGWLTINLICYSNISKAPIFRQFYKLLEHFRLSAYAEFMCQNYVTNSEPYFY